MRGLFHSFAAASQAVLLATPPLIAGTLLAMDRYAGPLPGSWRPWVGLAALLAAVWGVGLLAALAWHRDRHLRFRDGYRSEAAKRDEHERRARELQGRVDVLTAEREIGLILNIPLPPEVALERVMTLIANALSAGSKDHVGIYLRNGGGAPRLVAALDGGRLRRPKAPEPCSDDPLVTASSMVISAESDRLMVGAPLAYDQDIIGTLKLDLRLDGAETRRQERVRFVQENVPELARFVSLALKTQDLYRRATEDGLTGLSTRRHFAAQLELLFSLSRRHGDPLSLLMVDVDHFKKVNDAHGHPAGDEVLKGVAEILKRHSRRAGDLQGGAHRYGGEEMSILLPRTDHAGAKAVAEKIRREIEAKTFRFEGKPLKVTVSVGVAQLDMAMGSPEMLVQAADGALYTAKTAGRNRVVVAVAQKR